MCKTCPHNFVNMEFVNVKLVLTINLIIATTLVRRVSLVSHPYQTEGESFCYNPDDRDCGPSTWSGVCKTGRYQSPIDLNFKRGGIYWRKSYINFSPPYFRTHRSFFARNTGHSFRVQFSSVDAPSSDLRVSGAGLDGEYSFAQLHFHWGQRDKEGSEHTLMGRRYPMEAHFVHFKSKYRNFGNAMDEEDPEAVAVFALMFEIGPHNPALEPIIAAASSPSAMGSENEYVKYRLNLNIRKLLPQNMDFVRYLGSLTTPPCTQTVGWTVFIQPVTMSGRQMDALRKLKNLEHERYFNYRPLQPLNGRQLQFYKVSGGGSVAPGIKPWVVLGDNSLGESIWSQNWFLKKLFNPMYIVFNK